MTLHKEAVVDVCESAELEGFHKRNDGGQNEGIANDRHGVCKFILRVVHVHVCSLNGKVVVGGVG